ncbi:MAG: prepilin-type N-terminal cleavage/methylation domain-containing protein [Clostridiaceae bacterium]|nr:prepilin-type N-terminal cleavage/methylation domain-containing protein [Clostridiaceae bacterium]
MKKQNQKGFTLIEILVVIAILGILAVVTLVALNPVKRFQDARNSRRREDVNAVLQAVSVYTIDNAGDFPTIDEEALAALTVSSSAATCGEDGACNVSDLDGLTPYLNELPLDPDGSTEYLIGVDSTSNPQHIIVASNNMEINDDQTAAVFYLTY